MGSRQLLGLVVLLPLSAAAGSINLTLQPDPGVQSPTTMNNNWSAIEVGVDDNDARLDAILSTDTCTTPPCDLTAGTTIGGASIQTGTDDDVPEAGDFGALALTGPVTSSGLATTIAADAVTLATHTTGQYVADVNGDSEIVVTGADAENSTKTLSLAASITRDSEVASQTFGTGNPPGTCTQGNWYTQTSGTLRICQCVATNSFLCATASAP